MLQIYDVVWNFASVLYFIFSDCNIIFLKREIRDCLILHFCYRIYLYIVIIMHKYCKKVAGENSANYSFCFSFRKNGYNYTNFDTSVL